MIPEEAVMEQVDTSGWKRIGRRPSDLWVAGVFAIRNERTGKTYFVGATNMGKRVRDQHFWLTHRVHHNSQLQTEWLKSEEDFEFYVVRRVSNASVLKHEKQTLIDHFSKDGRCYNSKRAEPRRKAKRAPTSVSEMFTALADLF